MVKFVVCFCTWYKPRHFHVLICKTLELKRVHFYLFNHDCLLKSEDNMSSFIELFVGFQTHLVRRNSNSLTSYPIL